MARLPGPRADALIGTRRISSPLARCLGAWAAGDHTLVCYTRTSS